MENHTIANTIDLLKNRQKKLNSEVQAIKADIDTHRCTKETDFNRINDILINLQKNVQHYASELGSWKFFKTIFISVLGVMLGAALAAVYHFVELKSEVARIRTQNSSIVIENKLNEIQSTLKTIKIKND